MIGRETSTRGNRITDLPALLHDTRRQHPGQVAQALVATMMDACQGHMADDATIVRLDRHGSPPARRSP